MNDHYRVPLLTTDLKHEELMHHISDSLEYLQIVITDVFSNVEEKISTNRSRLEKIDKRAKLVQSKVNHLRGRKKATQVFSSAKYPAADMLYKYHTMFMQRDTASLSKKPRNFRLTNKQHLPPTDECIRNKLKFYSVKVANETSSDVSSEGLGRLPSNTDSISSLLLFNTAENPYKKYVLLDPRGVVTKTRQADSDESFGPAEAPMTIALGDELMEHGGKESYIYRPDLGEVPTISVPDTLPDLLDVADDLVFGAETGPSIAPSTFTQQDMAALPELPSMVEESPSQSSQGVSSAPPPPPPIDNAPPPPPPPPVEAPPPPPPTVTAPPPPPVAAPSSVPAAPAPVPAPAEATDDGGDRGGLLAAIRNAGGAGKARLKKANERKVEKKKKKEGADSGGGSSGGGDLMSDLASMLTMRRRGIAGGGSGAAAAKNTSDEAGAPPVPAQVAPPTGVMSKISELIPYSPAEDKDGDDDDWDD